MRESKLQIPTRTIEYIEVNDHSLLTEIASGFDEEIDPNSSFETCFEVFTAPNSSNTPKVSLEEKNIIQTQGASFQEFPWINLKFLSWTNVQNVYAAQVFDAVTVKVSFNSQEISKIEQTQSQHQASYLQLVVPTRVKTIAFSKAKSTSWHAGSLVITDGQKYDLSLRSPGPLMLIYFYIIMIKFLLRFAQVILARTGLSFCVPYSFFPPKTSVDFSNCDLNFDKWCF